MPLTQYAIAGSLRDALDTGPSAFAEVLFIPIGSHDSRVEDDNALLGAIGPIRAQDLPDPYLLDEGLWRVTISTKAKTSGWRPVFQPITVEWDHDGATTWAEIVAGAVTPVPLSPTIPQQVDSQLDSLLPPKVADPSDPVGAALSATYGRGINVLDHGAVGNDITFDNYTAIAAAMTAADAAGSFVFFPPGDFRFSAPIVLKASIQGSGNSATQLRPLASFTGTSAIDMFDTVERKFIKDVRISGAGTRGCIGSSSNGHGSSQTLFENVWFTDTNTSNYAVSATSTVSGPGALTGATFLRCTWENTPHMVFVGDNQDDVTFISCRFAMLDGNRPTAEPIVLRGQNILQEGCFYELESTNSAASVKAFFEVSAHVVAIRNAFVEVQGGMTTNFTHLFKASDPVCHLTVTDLTHRVSGTSSLVYGVYTEAVSTTTPDDSVIEFRNWRKVGGPLARPVHIKVDAPAGSRTFNFSGLDTLSAALVTLASGTTSVAAADYLRLHGEWRGKAYQHTVSHDAALTLSYTSATFGALDFPPTSVDPRGARPTDVAVVGTTANTALYYRVRDGGTISKIALEVTTSNGNLSVGVYSNTGAGRAAAPAAQKATSGAVACPAVGVQEIALTAPVRVQPGDWIAISSDSTTAAFRSVITAEQTTLLASGLCYKQATAHPLPATPASLTAVSGRNILLVGTE